MLTNHLVLQNSQLARLGSRHIQLATKYLLLNLSLLRCSVFIPAKNSVYALAGIIAHELSVPVYVLSDIVDSHIQRVVN